MILSFQMAFHWDTETYIIGYAYSIKYSNEDSNENEELPLCC